MRIVYLKEQELFGFNFSQLTHMCTNTIIDILDPLVTSILVHKYLASNIQIALCVLQTFPPFQMITFSACPKLASF